MNELQQVNSNKIAVRDITVITAEIKDLCRQARTMALVYAVEIGRRLDEAKHTLPHGEWGAWLEREVEFSHSTANNFMKLYEEYGARQLSLLGTELSEDSQSFANIPYSRALQLLAIPKEEREEFAKKTEDMSVKELRNAIKERDRAKAAESAALEKLKAIEAAQSDADKKIAEAAKLEEQVKKLEIDLDKSKANAQKLKDKLDDAKRNPKISEDKLAQMRREIDAEIRREGDEARDKELSELRAEADRAKQEAQRAIADADAVRRELDAAQRALKTAAPDITRFKALFDETQVLVKKLKDIIKAVEDTDPASAEKLKAALRALGGALREE